MLTLETDILKVSRVGTATAKKLKKLGVETVRDLLFYFPFRYEDFSRPTPVAELRAGELANVVGRIELIQNKRSPRRRMYITEALVQDGTETIKVVWFNQPFIARNLRVGDKISLAGKVEEDFSGLTIMSPAYEKIVGGEAVHTQGIVPNYHLTADITQKQIRFLIKQVIGLAREVKDWLPEEIRKRQKLLPLPEAVRKIHFPKTAEEAAEAKRRLAFDELFLVQSQSQLIKRELKESRAEAVPFREEETRRFVSGLPFKLTDAQRRAAWEILRDMEGDRPMARLLEGDVGSGKTLVALLAMLNAALNGKQAVLMVPTEILAKQHFYNISRFLKGWPIKIGLLTRGFKEMNEERKGSKKALEKAIAEDASIVIGTHALIQEDIRFKKLALAVIDEQHRFGVRQRAALMRTDADKTPTNAEDGKLLYEDLTYKIRGAIFEVKRNLGLGHKEVIYQRALEEEFKKIKLNFEREKNIDIKYNNKKIGIYKPDFIVENKIILEIKKLPFLGKFEKEQVWHYLKGSKFQLALLVNFAQEDIQIERFINSRNKSVQVRTSPHLLSMTATPIPRSLALALYGDLDLSIIDEMPAERKKIGTRIVPEAKRQAAYRFIRKEIEVGRQVFVICPLIDISDKLGVRSVKEEFEKLDKIIFPDLKIAMLHGRLKAKEKETVMWDFLQGHTDILVSTSVVEVGVDVPNATIMMIEGADRFGLAQLHQFRGRVGRAAHQSYCFLLTESDSPATLRRLTALTQYHDGFSLAKIDLRFRGPGEVYGTLQKGFPELRIASLFDYELMKAAKEEAEKLIDKDRSLKSWPDLKREIGQLEKKIHLE